MGAQDVSVVRGISVSETPFKTAKKRSPGTYYYHTGHMSQIAFTVVIQQTLGICGSVVPRSPALRKNHACSGCRVRCHTADVD
jgi:hypothetical protein